MFLDPFFASFLGLNWPTKKTYHERTVDKYASILARKSGSCTELGIRKGIPAQSITALPLGKVFFHIRGFSGFSTMWNYCKALRSSPGFNVDQPPNDDKYTAEIFAMVRDNGRIMDDFS